MLQGKSEAEALAYVAEQQARREKAKARIAALTKERDEYRTRTARADGFDEQVIASLRTKAAKAGLKY